MNGQEVVNMRSDSAGSAAIESTEDRHFPIAGGLKSEKERAFELGISQKTMQRARVRGELSFVRLGDRVLYSDAHIREWLSKHERRATR
jgi:hypothetical protein